MKRSIKFILGIVFAGFVSFGFNIFAKNNFSNMTYLYGKTVSETLFKDRTTKREAISCYKYDYSDIAPNCSYEYVTVVVEITYLDRRGVTIANIHFQSNFRYNKDLKTARCMSTSHGVNCTSPKYSVSVGGRCKNLSLDIGESFGKIVLLEKSQEKDVCKYIFSCDKCGNLLRYALQ